MGKSKIKEVNINNLSKNVFINCPFDKEYLSLLRPMLFTILYLDYFPRIASERFNSAEIRIDKICELIVQSKYSIHDISRIESKKKKELARFNLPFELGIDYGCRKFVKTNSNKVFLILEKDRYRFQKALSDLSGVDISNHNNDPEEVVLAVRNWFVNINELEAPSGSKIWENFNIFWADFYKSKKGEGYSKRDMETMPIPELIVSIKRWINEKIIN